VKRNAVLLLLGAVSLAAAIGGIVVAIVWRNSEVSATTWVFGISTFALFGLSSFLWFRQLRRRSP
jgi:predicted membrane channel-forming protein YqfA (hemolysin III family)